MSTDLKGFLVMIKITILKCFYKEAQLWNRNKSAFIASATLLASAYGGVAHAKEGVKKPESSSFTYSESGIRKISPALYKAFPKGGAVTPQREPNIVQDKLLNGDYSLGKVLEAGQNQFNNPFLPENGHGEGEHGPRSLQRKVWNPRGGTTQDPQAWPFLRVNGIDSQSCFECHNTIGTFNAPGSKTVAKVRKPSAQGGSAGAASTAFINDQFPEALEQLLDPNPKTKAVLTKFARNPPHVFGAGYTQRLATEMTIELMAQAKSAQLAGIAQPNQTQSIALKTKGSSFGQYSVMCSSSTISSCTALTENVDGVQDDLIVRPFQWGGIASSVRHFARDALDFHFSVQAVEKVGHKDCDQDGLIDEMTVGNVSALTAYVTMFRPPVQSVETSLKSSVDNGEKLFEQVGCVNCHSPSLTIDEATLTIMTPDIPTEMEKCPEEVAQLTHRVKDHDVVSEAKMVINSAMQEIKIRKAIENGDKLTAEAIFQMMKPYLTQRANSQLAKGNFQIDLNLSNETKASVPAYVWPRLPHDGTKVKVPLYSDLKLHYMGKALSDNYAQPTDGKYAAQPGVYVTRSLWGVANTSPYMHDGRARTLREAVLLHGASGSDAEAVAKNFTALSASEQQSLLDFLGSQKLPIAEGVSAPEYAAK